MLRLLAVFTGGWTIAAATAVAGDGVDEFEVLDTLGRLADKSLVALDRNVEGETRYTMVETVRQYALDRSDPDELQQARLRHARFFVALARDFGAESSGGPVEARSRRIDADLENLLAAHATCGQHPDLVEPGLALVGGLANYWQHRGMLNLAWQITGEALDRDGPVADEARPRALDTKALVALLIGEYDEGLDACEKALAIARRLDDRGRIAALLARKLSILNARGQVDEARAVDDECMRLGQALGGRHLYSARHHRAELLRRAGDFASAQRLYEHNLAEAQAANRPGSVITGHGNLALVTLQQGDTALARAHLIALLDVNDADRDFISDILALQACAALAALKGAFHLCARLHAVANAMSDRMHYRAEPVDAMAYTPPIERARDALGDAAFAAILAGGADEKPDEVRKEARAWLRSLAA
jgi:tetratricopeptide (TPR) repeat protein